MTQDVQSCANPVARRRACEDDDVPHPDVRVAEDHRDGRWTARAALIPAVAGIEAVLVGVGRRAEHVDEDTATGKEGILHALRDGERRLRAWAGRQPDALCGERLLDSGSCKRPSTRAAAREQRGDREQSHCSAALGVEEHRSMLMGGEL